MTPPNAAHPLRQQYMTFVYVSGGTGLLLIVLGFTVSKDPVLPVLFGIVGLVAAAWGYRQGNPAQSKRFTVRPAASSVTRGDSLDVFLDLGKDVPRRPIKVGIVCTEYTEYTVTEGPNNVHTHVVHEEWLPFFLTAADKALTFTVPDDVPFSHPGEVLIIDWRVVATQGSDTSNVPLEVLP